MKRSITILLIMALVVSLMPLSVFADYDDFNNIEYPNPGALSLSIGAEKVANTNDKWQVNLGLTGLNLQRTSDIVLVLDRSGSMDSNNRMRSAKNAAKNFVNTLLDKADNGTRIALVSYSGDGIIHGDSNAFKDFNKRSDLISYINGLDADGGTFTQKGLKYANDLLKSSDASNKYIVLLSDGQPTYTYPMYSSYRDFEYFDSGRLLYYIPGTGNRVYGRYAYGDHYQTKMPTTPEAFNYNSRAGSGASNLGYISSKKDRNYFYNVANNTIAESNFIRNEGVEIYSVGLSVNNFGQYVLNQVAPEHSYAATNSSLNTIFQEIAGSISYAATNATVTCPIGDMFSMDGITNYNYQDKINVNKGEVAWNQNDETITWTIPSVSEGNPATMTYIVEIDSSAESGYVYPTNNPTFVDYTNALGEDALKHFTPIPQVGVDAGSIILSRYLVDQDGHPINSEGVKVGNRKEAAYLGDVVFKEDEILHFNYKYEIVPEPIEYQGKTYVYYAYKYQNTNKPVEVTLNAASPSINKWLAYTLDEEAVNIVLEGSKNTDGTVDLSWNAIEGADRYILEKSVNDIDFESPELITFGAEDLEWTDSFEGLNDHTKVYYKVHAMVDDESYDSNTVNFNINTSGDGVELNEGIPMDYEIAISDPEGTDNVVLEYTMRWNNVLDFNMQMDDLVIKDTNNQVVSYALSETEGDNEYETVYRFTLDKIEDSYSSHYTIDFNAYVSRNLDTPFTELKNEFSESVMIKGPLELSYYIDNLSDSKKELQMVFKVFQDDVLVHEENELISSKSSEKPQGLQ